MQESVEERAKRLGLSSETVDQRASRLGLNRPDPSTTRHDGVPFVNAKPDEPTIAERVGGVAGSLGRFVAPDEMATVRSLAHDPKRTIVDLVKGAVPRSPKEAVMSVVGGPMGLNSIMSRSMERAPSVQQAREEIEGAESTLPFGVSPALGAVGALAAAGPALKAAGRPAAIGALKLVEGGLSPVRTARRIRMGLEAAAKSAAKGPAVPKAEGLQGAFESASENQGPQGVVATLKRAPVDPKQGIFDAFSRDAQAADNASELPDVVRAVQRNRTESGVLQRRGTTAAQRSEPVKPPESRAPDPEDDGGALMRALKGTLRGKGVEPRYAPARTPKGALQRDLKSVTDDELEQEYHTLTERLGQEEAGHSAAREAGYRSDYDALPSAEKTGRSSRTTDQHGNRIKRQAEDLPDADGVVDPEQLAADNKVISEYSRRTMARQAQEKALKRIEDELTARGRLGGGGGFSSVGGSVPFSALALAGGAAASRKRP